MIAITPLTAADCSRLEGIDPEWPAEILADFAARPAFAGFMAEYQSDPAGFIMGWSIDDVAEIIQISVAARRRRCGIGAALLEQFLKECASGSCHLEVSRDNTAAIGLYQQFGFRTQGVRESYYRSGGAEGDAVLMRLDTRMPES